MNKPKANRPQMTLPPGSPKLRKLAVYGRRSSGKTCILTALAMSRLANPRGYSCLWISDHANCPQMDGDAGRSPDDPLLARWRGKEMLVEQCERLRRGELPVATELRQPLRLLYQFTKSEGEGDVSGDWTAEAATFFTELIDYSGELINPDNDTSFADTLMAHLQDCDGLLILAEATTTVEQNERLHSHLELLRQVLPAVAERRRKQNAGPFPIALLLNKWDRMVDASQLTPLMRDAARPDLSESERGRTRQEIAGILDASLDRFFRQSPPVPQLALASELEAVAGGKAWFRTFCVSALGPCISHTARDGSVSERPVELYPLGSYGLEDPFVWLAQVSDTLGLQRIESAADNLRPWHVQALADGTLPRLVRQHERLARLYSAPHKFPARLAGLRSRLLQWFAGVSAIALSSATVLLMLSVMLLTAWLDSRQWSRFGPLLDAADTQSATPVSKAGLLEAESWVGVYAYPGWKRFLSYLLVQPQADAAKFHASVKERLQAMESEERLVERIAELEKQAGELTEWTLADRKLADLRELQVPTSFKQALERQQQSIAAVENRVMLLKHGEEYLKLQAELDRLLQQSSVVEAGRVVTRCPDTAQQTQLRNRFSSHAPRVMSGAVRNFLQRSIPDFTAAVNLVQNYRTQLGGLLDAEQLEALCGLWDKHISELRDYYYYGQCVRNPLNVATLTEYLTQTGSAGFRAAVIQKQLKYLAWMKEPRDWKVEVSRLVINYHNGSFVNNPDVTTRLLTETEFLTSSKVEDMPVGTAITGLSSRLQGLAPEARITLRVAFLVDYVTYSSSTALGEFVWTGQLCDVANTGPFSPSHRGGDDGAVKNVVELQVQAESDAGVSAVQLQAPGDPPELLDEELL